MIKEYITTYNPAHGGAYLRNISGLTKKEEKKITDDYISIEPEEDILQYLFFLFLIRIPPLLLPEEM